MVLPTLLGKVEFEMGEEGREREVLDHLLRLAIAETFRDRLAGLDLSGFTDLFAEGGDRRDRRAGPGRRPARARSARCPGCPRCSTGSGYGDDAPAAARSPPRSSSSSRACT